MREQIVFAYEPPFSFRLGLRFLGGNLEMVSNFKTLESLFLEEQIIEGCQLVVSVGLNALAHHLFVYLVSLFHLIENILMHLRHVDTNFDAIRHWLLRMVSVFEPLMLLDLFYAVA